MFFIEVFWIEKLWRVQLLKLSVLSLVMLCILPSHSWGQNKFFTTSNRSTGGSAKQGAQIHQLYKQIAELSSLYDAQQTAIAAIDASLTALLSIVSKDSQLRLVDSAVSCASAYEGGLRWDSTKKILEACDGVQWSSATGSGAGGYSVMEEFLVTDGAFASTGTFKYPVAGAPENTYALVIQLHADGAFKHQYFSGYFRQVGTPVSSRAYVDMHEYYSNVSSENATVIIPWDMSLTQSLQLDQTGAYYTGALLDLKVAGAFTK